MDDYDPINNNMATFENPARYFEGAIHINTVTTPDTPESVSTIPVSSIYLYIALKIRQMRRAGC